MKKAVIALVAVAIGAAACGGPSSGTVTDRRYHRGYSYWATQCVPVSHYNGKTTSTTTHCYPVRDYQPPSWGLKLRPVKGDPGWRDVDQHEYDLCIDGDEYPECVAAG